MEDWSDMRHFCVITNTEKQESCELAERISGYLAGHGCTCYIAANKLYYHHGIRHYTDEVKIPENVEAALVLGGDGTMIQAAIDLVHRNMPMLGINLGTMGFLTEVEKSHVYDALDQLIADRYHIENRIMLEEVAATGHEKEHQYGLNDMVLTKRGDCRLITIHVYINGELADVYRADGLVVSTPTGSTGYNLSAGGPVLAPHTHATVITPICAHSLNKRSLVFSAHDCIELEIGRTKEAQEDLAVLVVDGHNAGEFRTGDRLEIHVPQDMTQLIKLSSISFYQRMREKLNAQE